MLHLARFLLAALAAATLVACATPTLQLNAGAASAGRAIVTVPEQVEIATINGVEPKGAQSLLSRGDRTLELAPGRYEILAYYREIWPVTDGHDTLMSDPALFVLDAKDGGRYRVDYARPERYAEARTLATNFQGWIIEEKTSQRIASTSSGLKFRRGLTGQDRTLVAATAADSAAQQYIAPQAIPPPAPTATAVAAAPTVSAPTTTSKQEWGALMQAWWKQANSEERRAFLAWVAAQP